MRICLRVAGHSGRVAAGEGSRLAYALRAVLRQQEGRSGMFTVIITGGLASGKSTLAGFLCERGAALLDLDDVAHELLADDADYVSELAERFGSDILDDDGAVVPSRLAKRAFATPEDADDLDAIVLPRITERAVSYVYDAFCTSISNAGVLVVEVALLERAVELGKLANEIIAVCAAPELRVRRAIERGMFALDAARRMQLQPSDDDLERIADVVCRNEGTVDDLRAWADGWWESHETAR